MKSKLQAIIRYTKLAAHLAAAELHGRRVLISFLLAFAKALVAIITETQLDLALLDARTATEKKYSVTL